MRNLHVGAVRMLLGGGLLSAQGVAQSPNVAAPKFEVAAIRPAAQPPGGRLCARSSSVDAGLVKRGCTSLKDELRYALGVPENRLVGPAWLDEARMFDISAKLPDGASQDQLPEMFQSLLVDRFGLVFHRESKEQSVYALIVAKDGPKLKPALPEAGWPAWVGAASNISASPRVLIAGVWGRAIPITGSDGVPTSVMQTPSMGLVRRWLERPNTGGPNSVIHYEAPSMILEGLAELAVMAGNNVETIVIDMTGLKERYQVNLDIPTAQLTPDMRADDRAAAQLRIVQDGLKKLGLQLELRKAPVEIVVIDHLEKTPTAN